jgi:hypothetical protein
MVGAEVAFIWWDVVKLLFWEPSCEFDGFRLENHHRASATIDDAGVGVDVRVILSLVEADAELDSVLLRVASLPSPVKSEKDLFRESDIERVLDSTRLVVVGAADALVVFDMASS